jgi:Immunoglobulin I-set domain
LFHLLETYLPTKNEIVLEAHIRGEPRPTIRWLHNGVYIKKGEKYYITYDEEGHACLHINFPGRFDTGVYTCRADNPLGRADSTVQLNIKNQVEDLVPQYEEELAKSKRVEKYSKYVDDELIGYYDKYEYTSKRRNKKIYDYKYRLKFVTKLADQSLSEGADLKFTCYVDGKFPTFTWFKDSIPLIHSRKYRQQVRRDGKVTLQVINVSPIDAGVYKIVASNYAGEIESTAKVTIFENPYVVFVPPTFTNNILGTLPSVFPFLRSCVCRPVGILLFAHLL